MKRITIEMSACGPATACSIWRAAPGSDRPIRRSWTGGASDPRRHQWCDDRRSRDPFARSGHDERELLPSRREALPFADAAFVASRSASAWQCDAQNGHWPRCIECCGRVDVFWCWNFPPQNQSSLPPGAFQSLWPAIGKQFRRCHACRYLVESIEMHPTQKRSNS